MPRTASIPCAGGCGRMCWKNKTCRAPGEQMCRECRRAQTAAANGQPNATCPHCGQPYKAVKRSDGVTTTACSRRCSQLARLAALGHQPRDHARLQANWRANNHRRRLATRVYTDITPAFEQKLRADAKHCPLCSVRLVAGPYLPASKELDHIIPLNMGGTHTIGNCRIPCRDCNLRRPKDGSDYTGPVTLWPQTPGFTMPVRIMALAALPKPSREQDGRTAAELRAQGRTWREIAAALGYSTGSNAGAAARRYGDPSVIAQWPEDAPFCRACQVPLPRGGRGRPRKYCDRHSAIGLARGAARAR